MQVKDINLDMIKALYKNRFGITRGKKAPIDFTIEEGGVKVKNGKSEYMFLPFEMFEN